MSTPKRFFAGSCAVGKETVLEGEEFEHAKNVLRVGVGDEVILLDNSGKEFSATVSAVEKRCLRLTVDRESIGTREAETDVALLFGYLKNADKNEFTVQKAVELGVKRIICFSSEFSSSYMNGNKLERLNKVSKESAKQCLRSVAPVVEYCDTLESALRSVETYENKLFACEFVGEENTFDALNGSTAIVVGSEGGFSESDLALAKERGFTPVSLGKRILRAETASVALCSVVMFSLGELGGKA